MSSNNMEYVRLGNSGLKVSRLILGCMSYAPKEFSPWMLPEPEAIQHVKLAYDMGINTFDTSCNYGNGASETYLGNAIKQLNLPRDEIVVMTKVWGAVGREISEKAWMYSPEELVKRRYVNQYGLSRKHLFQSVKHSLERLQLEYIDVLQAHRFDPDTPVEETMQALHDLVKSGMVRYIGMSSCYAWQFQKMQMYAQQHGLTQFISMQNLHNPVYREEEREMMPMLMDMGVGVIPWSPMAAGFLTKPVKVTPGEETTRQESDFLRPYIMKLAEKNPWPTKVNEKIGEIAAERKVSMAQVCIAWTLSKPFITAPIVGTTSLDKLKDCVDSLKLKLTEEEIKSIDDLYQPQAVFGFR